jgi:cellulose 1,4-beta-cellobiosidase
MPAWARWVVAARRLTSGKRCLDDAVRLLLTCDFRESNAHAFAFTPHACENNKYHVCEDTGCGGTYSEDRFAGDCDANGCDYNPYRMGNKDFYGKGMTVDTSKKFT